MKNLNDMTSKELKEVAKNLHITGWWKMKKEELITAISSMTKEEIETGQKEEEEENKLFEHYQKNWSKYGPKNDWVDFLKKYKKGKIDLIDDATESCTSDDNIQDISLPPELEETETFEPEDDELETKTKTPVKSNTTKTEVKKPSLKIKELTFNGKTQTIKEWAAELDMPWPTLYDRINRNGWAVDRALTTPVRKRK